MSGFYLRPLLLALVFLLLGACAGVKTVRVGTSDYMAVRRGDVLTTGKLSAASHAALQVLGLDAAGCRTLFAACRQQLVKTDALSAEQRMATLAELWLQQAVLDDVTDPDLRVQAYLESARHAFGYLFFTERQPNERALEDRQTQVRDYYNYAVQQAVTALFNQQRQHFESSLDRLGNFHAAVGSWSIHGRFRTLRLSHERQLPTELIPAASLTFKGVRTQYRRDGIGAELVAVMARKVITGNSHDQPFHETPFPALTAVLRFPGDSLEEVLTAQDVELLGFDPYRLDHVTLAGQQAPLAANFTSGYGLWLARSGFASQSLQTLVGRGNVLEDANVYLMQPYDPRRRIIVLLHGLASSPEAWINVANELLGDEQLRKNYQIWQLYYPTNVPISVNRHAIEQALQQTIQYFDPHGRHIATRDMVLIGHSMGGVLARLLVSHSGDSLWDDMVERFALKGRRKERARELLEPYAWFRAMPQVHRAVFIAAPHKGSPAAEYRLARWSAQLIKLPFSMLGRMTEIAQLLVDPSAANATNLTRGFNSIDNLSEHDPFIRSSARLPVAPGVRYHSIIGQEKPQVPLLQSSDGVVPYLSAHLDGADSEKVIQSWHSVQETPKAIVEIRRILHEHLHSQAGSN